MATPKSSSPVLLFLVIAPTGPLLSDWPQCWRLLGASCSLRRAGTAASQSLQSVVMEGSCGMSGRVMVPV